MAVVRRTVSRLVIVAVACSVILSAGKGLSATPLVTGNLLIYYDFDNFTDTVMDGSGNGFNGKVQDATRNMLDGDTGRTSITTTGVISNDHAVFKRGGGAIQFLQSTVPGEDPVFVDLDGGVITTNHPELKSTTAVSYAAWMNLAVVAGTDSTVFNGSSLGHGAPHFQIQSSGTIRFTQRDEAGVDLVSQNGPWPNQPAVDGGAAPMPWPTNEWHHVAVTYDYNANGGAGSLDMYYDGVLIRHSGNTGAGTPPFGTWQTHSFNEFYDGLGLGCVYDSGSRRATGLLDEAYIFTRKLTEAEVLTLYNIPALGVPGDYNGNGTVDGADYVLWRKGGPLQNEVDAPGTVNAADYTAWRARFGNMSGSGLGSGGAVPEPASLGVLLVCLGFLAGRRRPVQ
jgi:hypothetical protein